MIVLFTETPMEFVIGTQSGLPALSPFNWIKKSGSDLENTKITGEA
jgi:hypothetical protein